MPWTSLRNFWARVDHASVWQCNPQLSTTNEQCWAHYPSSWRYGYPEGTFLLHLCLIMCFSFQQRPTRDLVIIVVTLWLRNAHCASAFLVRVGAVTLTEAVEVCVWGLCNLMAIWIYWTSPPPNCATISDFNCSPTHSCPIWRDQCFYRKSNLQNVDV